MKNRLVLPVVLVMFGAVVFVAATATAADKPEQDVSALIKALSERLEAQDRKISQLETKLTDEALSKPHAMTKSPGSWLRCVRTQANAALFRYGLMI